MKRSKFINPEGTKSKAYVRAPKQEKLLAKRGGSKLVKGSGVSPWDKGDVRGYKGKLTIEAKCTSRKSFSVTRDTLRKLEDAACSKGELPLLIVEFLNTLGLPEAEIAIIPMRVLDELLDNQQE